MKKIFFIIITTLLTYYTALTQNTEGKEFWVTYGYSESLPALPSTGFVIRIVNGNQPTTGYIYFKELGTYEHFTVNPFEIYNYSLTDPQKLAVYNTTMGKSNKSIYLYSEQPVTVYSGVMRSHLSDVTNLLPVTALGKEYYQISYKPFTGSSDAYAVVAIYNNTQVYHNKVLGATLQAGEVYYRTDFHTDMTGACITASNPVAFFAENQQANVPFSDIPAHPRSRLFQQLAPVNTWDKTFFVPVTLHLNNRVRIVAAYNGTNITQKGGIVLTDVSGAQTNLTGLQAGQFVELIINSADSGCFITANHPVAVCSYIPINSGFPASPAQCWIPGIKQTVPRALIAPFQHYFNLYPLFACHTIIITPTDTKGNTKVSVNDAPPTDLVGGTWKSHTEAGMSYYSMPLTDNNATYIFSNSEGIIVLGYGTGLTPVDIITSYYYLACSAMRDLDAAFYANNIHFQDLKDNPICAGLVNFRAEINGLHPTASERIKWFVDGAMEPGTLNQETWSKTFTPGTYEIKMWVRYENDETAEKTGTLIIESCNQSQSAEFYVNNVHHTTLKDTTFCNKNVNFRAEIEGLHPTAADRIKWYIDGIEEISALNETQWSNSFENGTYEIKLVVHYDNDTYATFTGILKVRVLWIKIRNVRY